MAIIANGARLSQEGYRFGVQRPDGYTSECISLEVAQRLAGKVKDGDLKVVFRAVYTTDWMEALD